jgi:transcriptional regulator with XRE-family HTH domain
MRKARQAATGSSRPEWAAAISDLRNRLDLSQSALGQRIHMSAMAISRWERGVISNSAISPAIRIVGYFGLALGCAGKI